MCRRKGTGIRSGSDFLAASGKLCPLLKGGAFGGGLQDKMMLTCLLPWKFPSSGSW